MYDNPIAELLNIVKLVKYKHPPTGCTACPASRRGGFFFASPMILFLFLPCVLRYFGGLFPLRLLTRELGLGWRPVKIATQQIE